MGMMQSRTAGGRFHFEEDPSYQRDADDYMIENYAAADYVAARGPPSRVAIFTSLFLRKDAVCLRYRYRAVMVTEELRRLFALLVFAAERLPCPEGLLRHVLGVLAFLDFSALQPSGPKPFYASRASFLLTSVEVDKLDSVDGYCKGKHAKIAQSWCLTPDPTLPPPARNQAVVDVPVGRALGWVHPNQLLVHARCWMDGWKRLHMEFEKLPVFLSDTQPSVLWMMDDQAFGLVEANKCREKMW
eukprot:TRINITY_DN16830_c0_g1_i1.p2 TRINITY_DN16830_c0_g1~~TRINITY_DN16830_c0_g1_i1.p2  ORF type:complete len:244 (+),score=91.64 TRINITY_DN16830_c0_g1_i1:57-788(+)